MKVRLRKGNEFVWHGGFNASAFNVRCGVVCFVVGGRGFELASCRPDRVREFDDSANFRHGTGYSHRHREPTAARAKLLVNQCGLRQKPTLTMHPPTPGPRQIVHPANFASRSRRRRWFSPRCRAGRRRLSAFTRAHRLNRHSTNYLARRPFILNPLAQPKRQQGKPFQSVQSQPAISPYLNLYRNDANANSLPNYFAYVRPQLEQIEANRQQAAELQKLRGQVQNMSSGGGGQQSTSMSTSARYMDTAQFYRGMKR